MKNFRVVVELPRVIQTRNGSDVTVDRIVQFIYGRKNRESALRQFGSVKNLATLRKQGFNITRAEFKKYRDSFQIEQI